MSTQQNNPKDRRILGELRPDPYSKSISDDGDSKPTLSKEDTKRRASTGSEPSNIPIQKGKSSKPKVAVNYRPVPASIKLEATLEEALDLATPTVKHRGHRSVKLEPVQTSRSDKEPDIKPELNNAEVGNSLDRARNDRVKAAPLMEDVKAKEEESLIGEDSGTEKHKAEEVSVPKRIKPKKGVSFAARE
jgi:hypothetical protein